MAEAADRIEGEGVAAPAGEPGSGRGQGEPEVLVDSWSVLMVLGGIPAMALFFVVLFLLTAAFDLPF